jgi:hypothetical protein
MSIQVKHIFHKTCHEEKWIYPSGTSVSGFSVTLFGHGTIEIAMTRKNDDALYINSNALQIACLELAIVEVKQLNPARQIEEYVA